MTRLPGPSAPVDALLADDVLLDRLAARRAAPDDLSDDAVRLLAALAADADADLHVAVPAPAPAAADRRRRLGALAAVAALALLTGGAGAAAAVTGDPMAGVDAVRSAVAAATGADWLRPAADAADTEPPRVTATGATPAGPAADPTAAARAVLGEVRARLAAGDVPAAELGLARAAEALAALPAEQRAGLDAELDRVRADVERAARRPGREPAGDAVTPAPVTPPPVTPSPSAPATQEAPAPRPGHGRAEERDARQGGAEQPPGERGPRAGPSGGRDG